MSAPPLPAQPWTAREWSSFLSAELGQRVEVIYTAARRQVVSSRWRGGTIEIRMSRCFAEAPATVRADFALWMRNGRRSRKACARLDAWIEQAAARMTPARRVRVCPEGRTHDLTAFAAELCRVEFAGEGALDPPPQITWGARTGTRAVHSLRLGSYTEAERLVRIHPVLDQPGVPGWFVRFIVFHELLHVVVPPRPGRGARMLRHPREFRERERRHPDYHRTNAWQRTHLGALLESARSGRQLPPHQPSLFESA